MMRSIYDKYSRQIMLPEFGEEGQQRLSNAKVLIVGLGGLGTPVALYLAGAGVGRIGLCDPDYVSLSNLQRQVLYIQAQTGMPKVLCARNELRKLNHDVEFEIYSYGLTQENAKEIISQYDLVIDCTDNFETRYLIDDTCHATGIPWVHGAISEFAGEVSVMNHGERPRRLSDLYPDRESLISLPRETMGVIGAVPGVIGSIEACEAIKLIVGLGSSLSGKLFTIDLLTLQTNIIDY
ncbi:MAG: HesA/MoeB/ThiF family protein [Muribaculum sp.]|nr:HesA/MoeB/ThiF family protein [Muribaculum sp.]